MTVARERQFEYARERAVHAHLRAIGQALEQWGKASTNGAAVWEAAFEVVPWLWKEWRRDADDSDPWREGRTNLDRFIAGDLLPFAQENGIPGVADLAAAATAAIATRAKIEQQEYARSSTW